MPPETSHVLRDPVQVQPDDQVSQRLDRRAADFVAAPDGEGQAVAFQIPARGFQHHVGGRVVRIRIHRIRAVQMLRGGKAQILDPQAGDAYAGQCRLGDGIHACTTFCRCSPRPSMPRRMTWPGRR